MRLFKAELMIAIGLLGIAVHGETGSAALGDGAHYAAVGMAASTDRSAYFAPSMRFDADAGSVEVAFGIEAGARISLHAFDTQGKLLAVLLEADQASGYHHFSLFSNRLQGHRGKVVFQLRSGNAVLAESRTRPI